MDKSTTPPGAYTLHEILSQSKTWQATLESVDAQVDGWLEWLQQPRAETLFTGCGSTHYLSLAAAASWQALTQRRARGLPASEIWLYPSTSLPVHPALLVAVSRSSETTETLRAVETFQSNAGKDWLAITCYAQRALARLAPRVLAAQQAEEQSVAQTRSFTSMFLLTQAAAALAAGRVDFLDELRVLPQAVDRLIGNYASLAETLGQNSALERIIFLGSGSYYGLAAEAMLKMKEMSLSPSEVFHFMEFRHGPKSVVASGTLIVGLVNQENHAYETAVLSEMRALGASILALVESAGALPSAFQADYLVELQSGLGDLARGSLYLPVLQLLAYYRAIQKGLNPDLPNNLEAVVRL